MAVCAEYKTIRNGFTAIAVMYRPFGDQEGTKNPSDPGIMEIFRVARLITLRPLSCPGTGKSLKTMDFPSGHQLGATSILFSDVNFSTAPPSAAIT